MSVKIGISPIAWQNDDLPDMTADYTMEQALKEAREIIEDWRTDYNTNRPHTSLNGLTPTEFAARPKEGQNWNRLSL